MTGFEKGTIYNDLVTKIRNRKNAGEKVVLNIHIPGTGCKKDSHLITKFALEMLEKYANVTPPIPIIYFEGVGASGEGYLPPIMSNTYTLEDKELNVKERITNFLFGTSTSDIDGVGVIAPELAVASGVVAGAGKKNNTLRAIHTLEALEQDNVLPPVVHLTGHSRGAVNCIDLANKIYQKFGNAIKIHLTLTDPVPGPMHEHDIEEKTLPPNVVSCNIFYADSENGLVFGVTDSTRLMVTNPNTTLTLYSAKNSDHFNIGSKSEVRSSIKQLTCAINGINPPSYTEHEEDVEVDKTRDMKGKSWIRSGAVFYNTTPINSACDDVLTNAINSVRGHFEPNKKLVMLTKSKLNFTMPKIDTESERKKYIYTQYREQKWQRSHISSGEMLAFLAIIPTLGLSANLYRSNQEMTMSSAILKFALGLGSANIAPTVDMLSDTGRKLAYNLVSGGLFRPKEQKPRCNEEECQPLLSSAPVKNGR